MRRKDRAVTDHGQIKTILNTIKTCRLAMVDGGKPYVIPLSHGFTLDGGKLTVYFHSAKEGRKIDILKANNAVCFEMSIEGKPMFKGENACEYAYYFSSVIGFGNAEFIDDFDGKNTALKLITKHQSGVETEFTEAQTDTICVIKIETTDFTAKAKQH